MRDTIRWGYRTGHARKRQEEVDREEIEQLFLDAGWELDGSFEGYLLIGHNGERHSLLAHREYWETDNPAFELLDHEQMTTYWVDEVPTPPTKPPNCSGSMASLPRRGICPKGSSRLVLLLRRARRPSLVDLGETVHEPVVLLARLGPGLQVRFPLVGDGVRTTWRASSSLSLDFPLRAAKPFLLHLPQGSVDRSGVYLLEAELFLYALHQLVAVGGLFF
jgi:hypothetical protein